MGVQPLVQEEGAEEPLLVAVNIDYCLHFCIRKSFGNHLLYEIKDKYLQMLYIIRNMSRYQTLIRFLLQNIIHY